MVPAAVGHHSQVVTSSGLLQFLDGVGRTTYLYTGGNGAECVCVCVYLCVCGRTIQYRGVDKLFLSVCVCVWGGGVLFAKIMFLHNIRIRDKVVLSKKLGALTF